MSTKLTFKIESQGKPYAVIVLRNGLVTARMGCVVLRNVLLPSALLWAQSRNPNPASQAHVSIVGRFR
jgi:hypothetical protein